MDSSSNCPFADENRPTQKPQLQIQGPRPPPLSINKDSHKIKKPPKPPPPPSGQTHHHSHHQQPLIIYAISPKVINVTVADFLTTVQRLTGSSSGDGDVSPAERMAALEKAVSRSPKEKSSSCRDNVVSDRMLEGAEEGEGVEVGRVPGVLSPATLPPVLQEIYFSPVADPLMHWNYGSLNTSSPSSGFFSPVVGSPVLSPDVFGQIWNF